MYLERIETMEGSKNEKTVQQKEASIRIQTTLSTNVNALVAQIELFDDQLKDPDWNKYQDFFKDLWKAISGWYDGRPGGEVSLVDLLARDVFLSIEGNIHDKKWFESNSKSFSNLCKKIKPHMEKLENQKKSLVRKIPTSTDVPVQSLGPYYSGRTTTTGLLNEVDRNPEANVNLNFQRSQPENLT